MKQFKMVILVDVDPSKCSKYRVLPDIIDPEYIREQIGGKIADIDHPAVTVSIKTVKEIKE